jgi:putative two-component system response regulator
MELAEQPVEQLRILAVDDEEANVRLLREILGRAGYRNVEVTTDPCRAPAMFVKSRPELVLLDLRMPQMDGFELMERLGRIAGDELSTAFLVLTGDATKEAKLLALSLGARDFLTKPLDQIELLVRVRNVLQVQQLQRQLHEQNAKLEDEVQARTRDLERSRLEILARLTLAAEYRDDATQEHAWRIGRTCALMASAVGMADEQVELIARAAPLHDIGKVGIPDRVLLKPGELTELEFEQIKAHTTIGAEILSGSESPLLRLAELIALSHHERWDGGGYPQGCRGEEIPLPGRIAAVADVFDALTHERPYKRAWPVREAVLEIADQAGRHFDPAAVEAFLALDHESLLNRVESGESSLEDAPEDSLLQAVASA